MPFDGQAVIGKTMKGKILTFLTENKFRVQLSDGQLVDAVLVDELIEKILPYYSGPPITSRIGVVVEFRDRPAMHRIVEVKGNDGWCGEQRGCWR
jgi:hypothetical protein